MDRKPIRIALIGCGGHATTCHAAPLAHYATEHPGQIELVATCDLDREKAASVARRFGFAAAYDEMERMFSEVAPDAVVCVMPHDQIVHMGIALLRRGVPCTIEKPLGTSAEQAHSLAEVARQTQTPHMVSMNRRQWPHLVRALDWVRKRSALRFVRAIMLRSGRSEEEFIWATGVHLLDTMVHIAGNIVSHQANVVMGEGLASKWYSLSLKFAGGCRGELQILPTCGRNEETYELFGEGSCACVSMDGRGRSTLRCWADSKVVVDESIEQAPPFLADGSYGEVCAFVRCLLEGTSLSPTVADVLPAMDICFQLAEQSA